MSLLLCPMSVKRYFCPLFGESHCMHRLWTGSSTKNDWTIHRWAREGKRERIYQIYCGQERAKEKEFTKGHLEAEVRAKNGAGSIGRVLRKQIQMNGPVREKSSQRTEGKGVGKLCWINVPTTRRWAQGDVSDVVHSHRSAVFNCTQSTVYTTVRAKHTMDHNI